jgi:hypothetical protein
LDSTIISDKHGKDKKRSGFGEIKNIKKGAVAK